MSSSTKWYVKDNVLIVKSKAFELLGLGNELIFELTPKLNKEVMPYDARQESH